ncbi:MAG: DUF2283 domain-containing protein [Chlorobi bacterium]|nr:DUF2283 domain-containing protein [Chlorobiota bacterium]
MKIKYDKETDIMYIRFSDVEIAEGMEEKSGVMIDYGNDGKVVAIELLNASKTTESPTGIVYEAV